MRAIDTYTQMVYDFKLSEAWFNLLGKPGASGFGVFHSIMVAGGTSAPSIYYQENEGSQNYHLMPRELIPYLEEAIKEQFGPLIATALRMQNKATVEAARAAVLEHRELMAAAGVTYEP